MGPFILSLLDRSFSSANESVPFILTLDQYRFGASLGIDNPLRLLLSCFSLEFSSALYRTAELVGLAVLSLISQLLPVSLFSVVPAALGKKVKQ